MYRTSGKRLLDLALTLLALPLIAPLLLAIGLLVRFKFGPPILYRQQRPGCKAKIFTLYKFRTMSNERDPDGRLLPDKERLTFVGRFLRKYSLDELAQVFNVLKGDMSLVGPRPLLIQYLNKYTPEHSRRHEVKPGITGWAQVNGRNDTPFSKRLAMDVWYVNNCSLSLDLRILFITARNVIKSEGVKVDQDVHEIDDLGLYDESLDQGYTRSLEPDLGTKR